MRAILTLLILTVATQAGAECGKLCDNNWWSTATEVDVQAELDGGADLMARDKYGDTPLHKAASSGNPANIKALLEAGADIKAQSKSGQTALNYSAGSRRRHRCAG